MIPAIPPRVALYLFIVAGFGLALAGAGAKGYAIGKRTADAELTAVRLEAETSRADALARLAAAERRAARLQADAAARIEAARKDGAASSTTIREVIHANPDFGGLRRPAGLDRVRDDQLAAIAAAARRSADLSGRSLSRVSTADDADGPDVRGD